jgi:glycosyltransferase involved in cell wall biosynthesis
VRKALGLLRAQRPDLVHTHSSVDAWNFGVAARLLAIPIVRSRHLSTPIRAAWSSRLVYLRLADSVITSGQAIKDAMVARNRIPAERIVSVPAGIDEKRFHPDVDPGPVMREFGLSDRDFVVGIVAVLRNWKGHSYLIQAVAKLVRAGRPVKLLVVGAGPQEKNLRVLIQAERLEQSVLLAGYRQDVPNFIAAMDCMVLPSTENEATSQVLPQAMAMQVPVIATDVGGLSEVVIDRDTGLLIPPRDVEAIADAIGWIADHPGEARALAERGYAHCLENFTFDRMIDRTEQVYRSVLAAHARR